MLVNSFPTNPNYGVIKKIYMELEECDENIEVPKEAFIELDKVFLKF